MMEKYICKVCGYTYDPEKGDPYSGCKPGTEFGHLPENWNCPICLSVRDKFSKSI